MTVARAASKRKMAASTPYRGVNRTPNRDMLHIILDFAQNVVTVDRQTERENKHPEHQAQNREYQPGNRHGFALLILRIFFDLRQGDSRENDPQHIKGQSMAATQKGQGQNAEDHSGDGHRVGARRPHYGEWPRSQRSSENTPQRPAEFREL